MKGQVLHIEHLTECAATPTDLLITKLLVRDGA